MNIDKSEYEIRFKSLENYIVGRAKFYQENLFDTIDNKPEVGETFVYMVYGQFLGLFSLPLLSKEDCATMQELYRLVEAKMREYDKHLIKTKGLASLNHRQRIECNNIEFSSGDVVEILINDKWLETRIEYNDKNYYSIHGYPLIGHEIRYPRKH